MAFFGCHFLWYDFLCRLERSSALRSCSFGAQRSTCFTVLCIIFLLQILVYRWFNTTELNGKPSLFSKAKQLLGMNVNRGHILVSGWYLWCHFLTRVWLDVSYFPASIIWMSLSQVEDFSQNYLTLSFKLPFVFLTSSRQRPVWFLSTNLIQISDELKKTAL